MHFPNLIKKKVLHAVWLFEFYKETKLEKEEKIQVAVEGNGTISKEKVKYLKRPTEV